MWIVLSVLSALCLGCYDVAKKQSLNHFPVLFVLTLSVLISSVLLLPMLLLSRTCPDLLNDTILYVPQIDLRTHAYILIKSCLVLSSWVCAYMALKHLPLSTVAPMQATRPMWTLVGALLIFGERLNLHQWIGISLALGSLFAFACWQLRSQKSDRCAVRRQTNGEGKYYVLLAAAILLGSTSGLYDKYMMQHFDHNAVQVWYTFYQAMLMIITCMCINHNADHCSFCRHKDDSSSVSAKKQNDPHTRLNRITRFVPIIAISVFLVLSDFVYLLALSDPQSLIAVVATIRRGGTIIPFLYGIVVLRERDPWLKGICTAGILAGLVFLVMG